jgi:hypothetical protein
VVFLVSGIKEEIGWDLYRNTGYYEMSLRPSRKIQKHNIKLGSNRFIPHPLQVSIQ